MTDEEQPTAVRPSSGPDRDEMAAEFFPEDESWQGKSILDLNDPAAVAALQQLPQLYPELNDLDGILDEFLDDFLEARTSVGGQSRSEISEILKSMYGGSGDDDVTVGKVAEMLGAEEDD